MLSKMVKYELVEELINEIVQTQSIRYFRYPVFDAEDIKQELWGLYYECIHNIEFENIEDFRKYFYKCCKNKINALSGREGSRRSVEKKSSVPTDNYNLDWHILYFLSDDERNLINLLITKKNLSEVSRETGLKYRELQIARLNLADTIRTICSNENGSKCQI